MNLSIVLTGLCRRPDLFTSTVKTLNRLALEGIELELVIATWAEEINTFAEHLTGATFASHLIACERPLIELPMPGSAMHQQMTLSTAVETARHDLVFRMRSDLTFTPAYLRALVDAYRALPSPSSVYAEERDIIFVPWADIEEPFHIADECFLTTRRTALGLRTSDIEGLSRYGFPMANVHTLLYGPPYWRRYAIFDEFLMAQRLSQRRFNDCTPAKWTILQTALQFPIYRDMIALYWEILRGDFRLCPPQGELAFHPGGGPALAAWYATPELATSLDDAFSPRRGGYGNHVYAHDLAAIPPATHADPARALSRSRAECRAEFASLMQALG
jgi:hypothetical protein